jgi:hypothetical protein
MDIIWGLEQRLVSDKGTAIDIAPMHIWKDVSVKKTRQSIFMHGAEVTDIEHNGQVFKTVPVEWFLIQI